MDYGFRIYNPAIGKFLSVDPLTSSYPWYTPYQFAGNSPIRAIDLDGLEMFFVTRWYENERFYSKVKLQVVNFETEDGTRRGRKFVYGQYKPGDSGYEDNLVEYSTTDRNGNDLPKEYKSSLTKKEFESIQTSANHSENITNYEGVAGLIPQVYIGLSYELQPPERIQDVSATPPISNSSVGKPPTNIPGPNLTVLPPSIELDITFTQWDVTFYNQNTAQSELTKLAALLNDNPEIEISVIATTNLSPGAQRFSWRLLPKNNPKIDQVVKNRAQTVLRILKEQYNIQNRINVITGSDNFEDDDGPRLIIKTGN